MLRDEVQPLLVAYHAHSAVGRVAKKLADLFAEWQRDTDVERAMTEEDLLTDVE